MEKEIRKLATDFAAAELSPRSGALDDADPALAAGLLAAAAGNGFFSFLAPESAGGAGLGLHEYNILIEELAKVSPAVAVFLAAHALSISTLTASSSSLLKSLQKKESEGKAPLFTLAIKEEKSRNPVPEKFETSVRKEGGGWIISGAKTGVLGAAVADTIVVIGDNGEGKLCIIAVPSDAEGVRISIAPDKLGLRLLPVNDVVFEEVKTPEEYLIEPDITPERISEYFNSAGPALGAVALGIMKKVYAAALKYSTERYQGGKIICGHDAIKILLGDMLSDMRIAEGLLRDPHAGMTAAVFASEAAEKACIDSIQVHGGYGYMKDYEVERFLRDAKTLKAIVNPVAWKMNRIENEIRKFL